MVLLCLFRYHRLLRKLSKKQRLKMKKGEDYHAPKHIFGQASQEMSQAVSIEAPAGEAAGDETMRSCVCLPWMRQTV